MTQQRESEMFPKNFYLFCNYTFSVNVRGHKEWSRALQEFPSSSLGAFPGAVGVIEVYVGSCLVRCRCWSSRPGVTDPDLLRSHPDPFHVILDCI